MVTDAENGGNANQFLVASYIMKSRDSYLMTTLRILHNSSGIIDAVSPFDTAIEMNRLHG